MSAPSTAGATWRQYIPPEQCYWILLDQATAPRDPQAIPYACEPFVPHDVDALQVAWCRTPDGALLCAAVPHETVQATCASAPHEPWSVTPAALPAPLVERPWDELLPRLEFRQGRHLPPQEIRQRRRLRWALALLIVAAVALVVGDALRDGWHLRQRATEQRQDSESAIDAVLPAQGRDLPQTRLLAAMRRLDAGDGAGIDELAPHVLPIADRFWQHWPRDSRIQLQQLNISAERIALRARTPDFDAAQALADAYADLPGWESAPLQAHQQDDAVAVHLSLTAQPPGTP